MAIGLLVMIRCLGFPKRQGSEVGTRGRQGFAGLGPRRCLPLPPVVVEDSLMLDIRRLLGVGPPFEALLRLLRLL
jgi:hypothetical protein